MIITPLIRTIASESRADALDGLDELREDIDRLVDDYLNSPELQNPNASEYDRSTALTALISLNRLKVEIPLVYNGNIGLISAKETYGVDPNALAKIDGVIDSLKRTVRRLNIAIAEMSQKFGLKDRTGDNDEIIKGDSLFM